MQERGYSLLRQTQKMCQIVVETLSFQEIKTFNVGDKTIRERTGRPVVDHDNLSHEQTLLNEVNMDFRIPELPHSVVKHAQSTSVRELIQKIENHPDRHALQQDLRENQAYDAFSPESIKMIQEVVNIELCELLETEPKTQCTVRLSLSVARAGISCTKKQRSIGNC